MQRSFWWFAWPSPIVALACFACATGVPSQSGTQAATYVGGPAIGDMDFYTSEETVVSSAIDAPVESVWSVLPSVYDRLDVSLSVLDTVAMQVGNRSFKPRRIGGSRLSKYIDCGRGITATQNADAYEVTMSLLTSVKQAVGGGSVLSIEIGGNAKPRAVSGNPVRCVSKGTLEAFMADLVREQLASGVPPN
ncbi:MAG: hypothetical protein AMS18_14180 [Gemmatimonas sp. SG8_17]|nr:MAG: hypothetical protein AMS18_14180 [Gemmatimonas sp. SG8_17]